MSTSSLMHEPGISPGSPVVKPAAMSTEDLAAFVADTFAKLKTALPYIIELRERFGALPRGKANVMGCRTWTEFCSKVLHRTDSAVRKAIATEFEWVSDKATKRIKNEPAEDLTDEELEELKKLNEEWKATPRPKPRPAFSLSIFDDELPDNLKPTAAEIVEAGYRTLAKQRHPDHGGTQEAMQILNATVACLRRIIR
jgi:hypothetical protein